MAHEVPGLASVIFGRTKYADVWWRAVPTGMPVNGWLTDTVHAAFASGLSLDEGPRFLLAATAGYRLVGVACRAAELSKRFNADPRPLSCFVGWLSDSDRTVNDRPARLPSLSELRAHYVKWAGSDYDRYVRDVWDADIDVAGKPVLSVPAPPPWPGTAGEPDPTWYFTGDTIPAGHAAERLTPQTGCSVLCPEREQDALWAAGLVTTGVFTLVTGWSRAGEAVLVDRGFACAADVAQRRSLAIEEVPEPQPSPEPYHQADPHHQPEAAGQAEFQRPLKREARRKAGPQRKSEHQRRPREVHMDSGLLRKLRTSTARVLRKTADWLDEESQETASLDWLVPRATDSGRAPDQGDRSAGDSEEGKRRAKGNFAGFDS